ncbi:MAG: GGDEF domain-containing protein [Pseudomonadota bacterium]
MADCFFCGQPIDKTELSRHYLEDRGLLASIKVSHPTWDPKLGACSRCLETLQRDHASQSYKGFHVEEPTVVNRSSNLLKDAEEHTGACLITIHGPQIGKKFDLTGNETIIGRGETCAVRVNEENVSRQHAQVIRRDQEILIEDLNSTNGTYVNTRKITSHILQNGDLILIGNTIFKFISGSNVEHEYHEEIYRLATLDGLTQVYNKAFFMDKLAEEFSRSRRYARDLSMIMFDFDHFRDLNNTQGHLAGDHALKKTALVILKSLRKEDVFGRYGGEEFVILLPEIRLQNALFLAEKIRKIVEETKFEHNEVQFKVTISLGVATVTKDIRTIKQFLEKVDKALYKAKAEGRNCVR